MMTNVAQNEQQQKTTVKSVVESEPKKKVISSSCHYITCPRFFQLWSKGPEGSPIHINTTAAEVYKCSTSFFFSVHTLEKALFATKV